MEHLRPPFSIITLNDADVHEANLDTNSIAIVEAEAEQLKQQGFTDVRMLLERVRVDGEARLLRSWLIPLETSQSIPGVIDLALRNEVAAILVCNADRACAKIDTKTEEPVLLGHWGIIDSDETKQLDRYFVDILTNTYYTIIG